MKILYVRWRCSYPGWVLIIYVNNIFLILINCLYSQAQRENTIIGFRSICKTQAVTLINTTWTNDLFYASLLVLLLDRTPSDRKVNIRSCGKLTWIRAYVFFLVMVIYIFVFPLVSSVHALGLKTIDATFWRLTATSNEFLRS